MRIIDLVCRPDARQRLVLGLAAGAATFVVLRGELRFASAAIAGWNAVAVVILALDWMTILTTPQRKIRQLAQQQDLSRFLVFIFVVVAACAALFAVGFLIKSHKGQSGGHFAIHLLLTLCPVISSWARLHTVYSLRYGHTYYCCQASHSRFFFLRANNPPADHFSIRLRLCLEKVPRCFVLLQQLCVWLFQLAVSLFVRIDA